MRLIHIHPDIYSAALDCHTTVHLLDSSPPYSALSYTWGSPFQERFVNCDGQRLGVTLNLGKVLRSLRHASDARTFWIDAICIDQENIDERNSQVRLMKEIYRRAAEVVVWLGEDKQGSADGASLLPRIHAAAVDGKLFHGPDSLAMRLDQEGLPGYDSPVWTSLAELYHRSWFGRIWVVQELTVAKPATVLCGGRRVPWAYFAPAATCLQTAARVHYWDVRFRFDLERFAYMDSCRAKFENGTPTRLLDLLSATRSHFSTDLRDKVFAVLGLASDADAQLFDPDYSKSAADVYSTLTIGMIADQRSLEILSHKEDPWFTGIKGLPSWVVDWSVHPRLHPLWCTDVYSSYQAAGDSQARVRRTTADLNTLYITGFQVDEIKERGHPFLRYEPRDNVIGNSLRRMNLSYLSSNTTLYLEQARWKQWEDIALTLNSYPTGEDPFQAFLHTLIGGSDIRWNQSPHDLDFMHQAYLKSWDCLRDKGPVYCKEGVSEDICTHWVWYRNVVEDVAYGRLFFTSEKGYMGLAPPSTRPGDLICVLLGGRTPYILRPDKKRHYRLIGECYLHGQMRRSIDGMEDGLQEFAIN